MNELKDAFDLINKWMENQLEINMKHNSAIVQLKAEVYLLTQEILRLKSLCPR